MSEQARAGEGERTESAARNRRLIIIGGLVAFGMAAGFWAGFREGRAILDGGAGAWPAPAAIGLALAYLAAVIGGGIAMSRQTDEFERARQYRAPV